MARFPDEIMTLGKVTPERLCEILSEPINNQDQPGLDVVHALARLALAGRYLTEDEGSLRLMVVPGEHSGPSAADVKTERNLERVVGQTRQMPFAAGITLDIMPLVDGVEQWPGEFDLKCTVNNEQGVGRMASLSCVPHIRLGKIAGKASGHVWLFLPRLYIEGTRTRVRGRDREDLYTDGVRPALAGCGIAWQHTALPELYQDVTMKAWEERRHWLQVAVRLSGEQASNFCRSLLERLDGLDRFEKAFFLYELHQEPAWRLAGDAAGRAEQWQAVCAMFQEERVPRESWFARVTLRVSSAGHVLLWRKSGHRVLLQDILSLASEEDVTKLLKSPSTKRTPCGVFLWNEDITVWPQSVGALDGIKRIKTRYIEEEVGLERRDPGWQPWDCARLLPANQIQAEADLATLSETLAGLLDRHETKDVACELTVDMRLRDTRNTLTAVPRVGSVLYRVPTLVWWTLKHVRMHMASCVIHKLFHTRPEARIWPESLTLGAAAIQVLNDVFRPVPLRGAQRAVRKKTAVRWEGREGMAVDDIEVLFGLGNEVPMIEERGMFFVCDIVQNEGVVTWRMPRKRAVNHEVLATLYGTRSWEALLGAFGIGGTRTVLVRGTGYRRIHRTRGGTSLASLSLASAAKMMTRFDLQGVNIQLQPVAVMAGPDVAGQHQERPPREALLLNGTSIQTILNNIAIQFAHDVLERSPQRLRGNAYCVLTPAELRNVRVDVFEDTVLPFDAACLVVCMPSKWQDIFNFCFPAKGNTPPPNANQFHVCSYYKAWVMLMNRLNVYHAAVVREAVKAFVDAFDWLPYAGSGGMWQTSEDISSRWLTLPPGHGDAPAPRIAVNPLRYSDATLRNFELCTTSAPVPICSHAEEEIEEWTDSDG